MMMVRRKKPKHEGLHTSRLRPEANNPREVAFSRQWKQEHKYGDLLSFLLRVPCDRNDPECINRHEGACGYAKAPLGETTERDRIVAATVAQWLGSNCGFSFVQEALKRCGYRIVKPEPEEDEA
jgi:hypothetical protein